MIIVASFIFSIFFDCFSCCCVKKSAQHNTAISHGTPLILILPNVDRSIDYNDDDDEDWIGFQQFY